MLFDQFVHQSGDRAAHSSNKVERVGTRRIRNDAPFNGGDLTGDTVNAGDDLVALVPDVRHKYPPRVYC